MDNSFKECIQSTETIRIFPSGILTPGLYQVSFFAKIDGRKTAELLLISSEKKEGDRNA